MNNIHAEVDEILRTGNKKAIVSLFLSMQGNYIRATEAEAKLTEARADIERKDRLTEQMREALELLVNAAGCGRISAGHIRQARAALAAERGE